MLLSRSCNKQLFVINNEKKKNNYHYFIPFIIKIKLPKKLFTFYEIHFEER